MDTLSWVRPVSTPHKTKRFWLLVGLGVIVVLCAPLVQVLLGFPLLTLRVHFISSAATFALWITMMWFTVRFGVIAWFVIGLFFLAFGLLAQLHS
jgi:hypothetical protein